LRGNDGRQKKTASILRHKENDRCSSHDGDHTVVRAGWNPCLLFLSLWWQHDKVAIRGCLDISIEIDKPGAHTKRESYYRNMLAKIGKQI
jgi:hypothetical protein